MKHFQTATQTTSLKARPFLRFGAKAAGVLSVMLAALAPPALSQANNDPRVNLLGQECVKRKAQLGLSDNPSTQDERVEVMRWLMKCQQFVRGYETISSNIILCNVPSCAKDLDREKLFNEAMAQIRTLGK